MATNDTCERCGQVVDEHTVAEFRRCLSDLHDHDLPFEEMPETDQTLSVITAGAIAVKAGVHRSELGNFPVLIFDFSSPSGPVPPIALVLDSTHMRSVRTLVGSAIDGAIRASRKGRH